jgi:S1-C subfamily serine protease
MFGIIVFLGYAAAAHGQEAAPEPVGTITDAENVPREAEQAPDGARPLPTPDNGRAGEPARQEQPLSAPTAEEGTTGAAMTAPPARIDFRRFGVRFAKSAAGDVNATPAKQARANSLTVATVRRPSPASQIGIEPRDQIISVGGKQVSTIGQIGQALEQELATGPRHEQVAIPLVVRRGGSERTLTISNGELTMAGYGPLLTEFGHHVPPQYVTGYRSSGSEPFIPASPTGAYLGIELNSHYRNAAIVSRVLPGTPAAQAGLQEGDRIFAINNRPINSPNELIYWVGQMQGGDTIEISFERAHDVEVTLGARTPPASENASRVAVPAGSE